MSLILNALRKSEKERLELQPRNRNIQFSDTVNAPNKFNLFYYLMVIFCVLQLLIFFLYWNKEKSENTNSKASDKPFEHLSTVNTEHALKNKLVNGDQNISISALVDKQNSKVDVSTLKQNPVVRSKVNLNVSVNTTTNNNEISHSDENINFILSPIRQEIPFLSDLPSEFQQTVPDLTVTVFVYSDEISERFVMINGAKYKVGQSSPNGFFIKEINATNLVVIYKNTTFQIERP